MLIQMGNIAPHDAGEPVPAPAVTTSKVLDDLNDDGTFRAGYIIGTQALDVKDHLLENAGAVTHLPGNEAVLNILSSWTAHSTKYPEWVSVEAEARPEEVAADLERFLADYWHCNRGKPDDLEARYWTGYGDAIYPPGSGPSAEEVQ
jgi:hypothetical protein